MGAVTKQGRATRRSRAALVCASALVFVCSVANPPGRAHASGFSSARFGGEHGTAADVLPSAIYYNPAGIGLLDGQHLMIDATLALRSASYRRSAEAIDASTLDAVEQAGFDRQSGIDALAGKGTLDDALVLPFVGVVTDLGMPDSPLRLGAAFFVPFGGQSSWDERAANTNFPGAVDGPTRWYNIEGTIRSMTAAVAAAYRIEAQRLSFGVAGNLYFSEVNTLRARNANGTDNLITSDGRLLEGRSLLDVSGVHFGLGLGVMWEPVRNALWVGASYQSQPGFGTMHLTGTVRNTFGTAPPAPPSDVVLTESLPDIVRVGVRARPWRAVELRLGADWTRWSHMGQMCLADSAVGNMAAACATHADGSLVNTRYRPDVVQIFRRNWHDTVGARVSGSYFLGGDAVELYGGVGFDGSAIPDATLDPSLYDMNKVSFSLGATYRVNEAVALSLTLMEVLYLRRDTRGTAGNAALAPPSRQPANVGVFEQNIFIIQPAVVLSL